MATSAKSKPATPKAAAKPAAAKATAALPTALLPELLSKMQAGVIVLELSQTASKKTLNVAYANAMALKKTGLKDSFEPGVGLSKLFPNFEKRGITDLLLDALENGKSVSFEDIAYKPKVLQIESAITYRATPLAKQYLILVVENMTELKMIEEELMITAADLETARLEAERQAAIVRNMHVGCFVLKLESGNNKKEGGLFFDYANPAVGTMLDLSLNSIIGKRFADILPDLADKSMDLLVAVLKKGRTSNFEDITYRKDKLEIAQAVNYRAFKLGADRVGVLCEDITRARKMQELMEKQHD